MIEFTIDLSADGQRMDRYLKKLMPAADKHFIQKMLRKKRIKCNHKRTEPNQLLTVGDTVTLYFSAETFEKFRHQKSYSDIPEEYKAVFTSPVYEDEDILVVNKPVGLLCQRGSAEDPSLIDFAQTYLKDHLPESKTFSPGIANRLDRNTGGITLIPKNYQTTKAVNQAMREHQVEKYYVTVVSGAINGEGHLQHYLYKNADENIVTITDEKNSDSVRVVLDYKSIYTNGQLTVLSVRLHTGKTHQIRAQLAHIGYPVLGDPKYGDKKVNGRYPLNVQILYAARYVIPTLNYDFRIALPDKIRSLFPTAELEVI